MANCFSRYLRARISDTILEETSLRNSNSRKPETPPISHHNNKGTEYFLTYVLRGRRFYTNPSKAHIPGDRYYHYVQLTEGKRKTEIYPPHSRSQKGVMGFVLRQAGVRARVLCDMLKNEHIVWGKKNSNQASLENDMILYLEFPKINSIANWWNQCVW